MQFHSSSWCNQISDCCSRWGGGTRNIVKKTLMKQFWKWWSYWALINYVVIFNGNNSLVIFFYYITSYIGTIVITVKESTKKTTICGEVSLFRAAMSNNLWPFATFVEYKYVHSPSCFNRKVWIKVEISCFVKYVPFLKYLKWKPFATIKRQFATCGEWWMGWTTLV